MHGTVHYTQPERSLATCRRTRAAWEQWANHRTKQCGRLRGLRRFWRHDDIVDFVASSLLGLGCLGDSRWRSDTDQAKQRERARPGIARDPVDRDCDEYDGVLLDQRNGAAEHVWRGALVEDRKCDPNVGRARDSVDGDCHSWEVVQFECGDTGFAEDQEDRTVSFRAAPIVPGIVGGVSWDRVALPQLDWVRCGTRANDCGVALPDSY